jgi:mono/diheme cytochrome c family protein
MRKPDGHGRILIPALAALTALAAFLSDRALAQGGGHGGVPVAPAYGPPPATVMPAVPMLPSAAKPALPSPNPPPVASVGAGTAAAPRRDLEPSVDGRGYAHRDCAQCHAVERGAKSPDPNAAAFRDLAGISFGAFYTKYSKATRDGHHAAVRSPPPEEFRSIAAYIKSLDRP